MLEVDDLEPLRILLCSAQKPSDIFPLSLVTQIVETLLETSEKSTTKKPLGYIKLARDIVSKYGLTRFDATIAPLLKKAKISGLVNSGKWQIAADMVRNKPKSQIDLYQQLYQMKSFKAAESVYDRFYRHKDKDLWSSVAKVNPKEVMI